MECTSRSALRADALAEPARTSWLRQRFALASPALRQRFALAPLFGSVHAPCHTPLRQRFALAPRSSSPQAALRAACCDPRCLHTGPLNPRCVAALPAAAVTVTACGSSRAGVGPSSPVSSSFNFQINYTGSSCNRVPARGEDYRSERVRYKRVSHFTAFVCDLKCGSAVHNSTGVHSVLPTVLKIHKRTVWRQRDTEHSKEH